MEPLAALEIEDEMVAIHELGNQAMCRFFRLLVQLDEAKVWRTDGCTSMRHWVSYRFHYSSDTSRTYVRVAHALRQLPAVEQAYFEGLLSLDQLIALTRFATSETDELIAREAPGWSAAECEAKAKQARLISREDAERERRERSLKMRWDSGERSLKVWGNIPGADGRLVETVLTAMAAGAPQFPDASFDKRSADALVELASAHAGASDPDRANLVVHVDGEALVSGEGNGIIEGGTPIAMETVRRLGCDGRVQPVWVSKDGHVMGVGRMSRQVPEWLLRQLKARDERCRFPDCPRTAMLHAHHVEHWADGGETNEDNLILLCPVHHKMVHEGRWRVRVTASGRLRFIRPDGRPLANRPPPVRPSFRERTLGPRTRSP